jgi:opacity protein-like surface antigen
MPRVLTTTPSARQVLVAMLLLILLGTTCSVSYAQSGSSTADWVDRWALQFQVTDNFVLDDFQGATLSAKKQVSETEGVRIGADVGASFESASMLNDGDERDQDRNSQSVRATVQYLRYPVSEGAVKMYWGLGPSVGLARTRLDGTNRPEQTQRRFSVGLEGALGVEWFVHSQISLSAEYGAGLGYDREVQTVETESRTEQETTTDRFAIGARPVRFGVSVYF